MASITDLLATAQSSGLSRKLDVIGRGKTFLAIDLGCSEVIRAAKGALFFFLDPLKNALSVIDMTARQLQ